MYGYEYENNVLLALRLLKFLYQQDPVALKDLLERTDCDSENLESCAAMSIWEIFSDVTFDLDLEWETEKAAFSHPTIDKFYDLGTRWCAAQNIHQNAWVKSTGRCGVFRMWNILHGFPDGLHIFEDACDPARGVFSGFGGTASVRQCVDRYAALYGAGDPAAGSMDAKNRQ